MEKTRAGLIKGATLSICLTWMLNGLFLFIGTSATINTLKNQKVH